MILYEDIVKSASKTAYVRDMFRAIASRYDFMNRLISLGRDKGWRRLAVRKAEFTEGGRILDFGTGTGDVIREIIRRNGNGDVFAIDNCDALVEYGRRKPDLLKHADRIIWILGDGRSVPFKSDSLDGVIAAFSIRNMANLPLVFSELNRILKSGGRIAILDMIKPRNHFSAQIFRLQFKHIVPKLGKWLGSDPEAYHYLLPSIENFYTSEELIDVLKVNGFDDIRVSEMMFHTVALWIGTKI